MPLDIRRCIAAMRPPLVTVKSRHVCAMAVRSFLQAGGMNMNDRPGSAYQYIAYLPRKGFRNIAVLANSAQQNAFSRQYAQPGDIAVMYHGKHGHICMWSGGRWVSDFYQNNMWVYSGEGACWIFRYNGQVIQMEDLEPPINYALFNASCDKLEHKLGLANNKLLGKIKNKKA